MAGRGYPQTYREFAARFPDEAAWARHTRALGMPPLSPQDDRDGRHDPGEDPAPLTTWFEATWHVTTTKNGCSAMSLERTLSTRYRVAWRLLQRFRVEMVRAERAPLAGTVEVGEALVVGASMMANGGVVKKKRFF